MSHLVRKQQYLESTRHRYNLPLHPCELKRADCQINNVLYVLELGYQLLSVPKFDKPGQKHVLSLILMFDTERCSASCNSDYERKLVLV